MRKSKKISLVQKAFVWRSGRLGFGTEVPSGALFLMRAPSKKIRDKIEVLCRSGRPDRSIKLVPGVPEAVDDDAAMLAVKKFIAAVEWTLIPKAKRELMGITWAEYIEHKTGG